MYTEAQLRLADVLLESMDVTQEDDLSILIGEYENKYAPHLDPHSPR